jgi:hypothetical protein
MADDLTTGIDPAQAFDGLSAEVSLLRRAIEGLSAERNAIPDYGPTLQQIDGQLQEFVRWARKVNDRPAMKLTPDYLAQEMMRIAIDARKQDREIIKHADASMGMAIARLERIVESASEASEQWRALCLTGGTALVAGMLLILVLQELAAILPLWRTDRTPRYSADIPAMAAGTTGIAALRSDRFQAALMT